jgi:hypothetical protein
MNPDVALARRPFHFWEAESRTTSRQRVPRGTNAPTEPSDAAGTVAGMSTSSSLTGSRSKAAVGVARSAVSVAADTTDTAMRFKWCSASARPVQVLRRSYRRVNPGVKRHNGQFTPLEQHVR